MLELKIEFFGRVRELIQKISHNLEKN